MSVPVQRTLKRKFLNDGFKMIADYLEETITAKKPVINFHLPEELKKIIDFDIKQ